MNADGANPVRVTTNPWPGHAVVDSAPTWSPDGTRIAFDRLENGRDDLYVVNVDGSGLHQLTTGVYDEDAAWSPDGTQIAFDGSDRVGTQQIFVVDADGSDRRQLTRSASLYSVVPAWSPSDKEIAYTRAWLPFGLHHVWVMNADGASNHQLTSGSLSQETPAWSPDGQLIAYASGDGEEQNIWTMNADGTGQRQLTHGAGFDITPNWQPVPVPSSMAPLPAASITPLSRPTPEARLVAIYFRAEYVLYDDTGALSQTSAIAALTVGVRLITDAEALRAQTLPLVPKTKWGKRFKHGVLAMYASARDAGHKFNAAIIDALEGHKRKVRRDTLAGFRALLRMADQDGRLLGVL